jgi:hypothetical protein
VAVGSYETGDSTQAVAEAWNGSSWSIESLGLDPAEIISALYDVSCPPGSGACTAVGDESTLDTGAVFLARWDGSTWTVEAQPPRDDGYPTDRVSCASSTACMFLQSPTTAVWDGGSWTIGSVASPAPDESPSLNALSCGIAASCAAVGYFEGNQANEPLVEAWNGAGWTLDRVSVPAAAVGSSLGGVSCWITACTAVGSYDTSNLTMPLIERSSSSPTGAGASAPQ